MTDYILDLIRIMLTALPVYVLARVLLLRRRSRRLGAKVGVKRIKLEFNKLREVCLGLFVVFMLALMTFVFQGEYASLDRMVALARKRLATGEGINLIPFRTIRNYYRVFGWRGDLFGINIVGNVLMFAPWGFGLMFLWKKNRSFWRLLYFSAMLPICIEFFQLFIGRQVDVDDFILNFCGGMLGGILFCIFEKIFPGAKNAVI